MMIRCDIETDPIDPESKAIGTMSDLPTRAAVYLEFLSVSALLADILIKDDQDQVKVPGTFL